MHTVILFYCLASNFDPNHLCFRQTTYDDINSTGGTIHVNICGPAGPLMYLDQTFRYTPLKMAWSEVCQQFIFAVYMTIAKAPPN